VTFLKLTYYSGCLLLLINLFNNPVHAATQLHKNIEKQILAELTQIHPSAIINIAFNLPNTQKKFLKCKNIQIPPITKIVSGGRFSLRLTCSNPSWATYITFKASIEYPVAVATKHIKKGQKITNTNMRFLLQDITSANRGYFTTPKNLLGQDAKRLIRSAEIISPYMLSPPILIDKGDSVIIQANTGGLSISTIGTALQTGKLGKQIRVKNNRSGKTIRAYVASKGIVTTNP